MQKKKFIIITMCIAIGIMVIGYAAFSTSLKINGTANITSTWKVVFTDIEEVSKTSGVTITTAPTASGTTATFNVDLTSPGDNIVYQITVENQGTLDAIINDIEASETGSDAIKFEIEGVQIGDKLAKKTTSTFLVTIRYDNNVTSQPAITVNDLSISIHYIQNVGQEFIPNIPTIIPTTLAGKVLSDNMLQSDESIDFGAISSDTNGKGLYYTSTNTEDSKLTYYFRGDVENNYVSFAGFTWRIIRINEDGSVRLILQDSIGDSVFNSSYDDNAYVGYMYGTAGSSTYEETHANVNDSTIKIALDDWYEDNLLAYSSDIADSGFCNDRSIMSGVGYGKNNTYYGTRDRLYTNKTPQFVCPQQNDLFTVSNSKGNMALTYPIGLITADEVAYAGGGVLVADNDSYYLYTGAAYHTLSPRNSAFVSSLFSSLYKWSVVLTGGLGQGTTSSSIGVRPVINLKSSVKIATGDGTSGDPYIVETN